MSVKYNRTDAFWSLLLTLVNGQQNQYWAKLSSGPHPRQPGRVWKYIKRNEAAAGRRVQHTLKHGRRYVVFPFYLYRIYVHLYIYERDGHVYRSLNSYYILVLYMYMCTSPSAGRGRRSYLPITFRWVLSNISTDIVHYIYTNYVYELDHYLTTRHREPTLSTHTKSVHSWCSAGPATLAHNRAIYIYIEIFTYIYRLDIY